MSSLMTPVDKERNAMDFRLYLREKVYPSMQEVLEDTIGKQIDGAVSKVDENTYAVSIEKDSQKAHSLYNPLEDALTTLYHDGNIPSIINSDRHISAKQKSTMMQVYNDIQENSHLSEYMKMLYSLHVTTNSSSESATVTIML